jgi:hypothetical protein
MQLSKRTKIITGVAAVVLLSPFLWDLGRKFSGTGIYRRQCSGEVIKTRRTLTGIVDFFDCSGSRRERRSRRRMDRSYDLRGHYVAKIFDESGRTYEVSISGYDYGQVRPGQYVICNGGRKTFYASKEAAQKAMEKRATTGP